MNEVARTDDPIHDAVMRIPMARIRCPLCEWHYDIPPLDPRIGPDTLAGVFGSGIMLQQAINDQNQRTERELHTHLSTHKLLEWVIKVSSLQTEIDRLKASFP